MGIITLLNGESYNKEELLVLMEDDNFYFGHLSRNSLSQSSLKTILSNPYEYLRYLKGKKEKRSDALVMGSLVHWGYLEPEKFYNKHFIEAERVTDKDYKEALAKYGEENVYKAKLGRIAEAYIDSLNRCDALNDIKSKARIEVPAVKMFFEDIPIKGKADLLLEDRVLDLKTTMVDPEAFNYWKILSMDYDLQAFIYCQIFEVDYFSFIPISKVNKSKGLIHCGQDILDSGEEKFYKAIEIFKKFFYNKSIEESEGLLDNYYYEAVVNKPKRL